MFDVDIVIPVYKEKNNLYKLLNSIENNTIIKLRILICYDLGDPDYLDYKLLIPKYNFKIIMIQNLKTGPCEAVKTGFLNHNAKCVIVYPADDFINYKLFDEMFKLFEQGYSIVAPSRFIDGGSMNGAPFLKNILVRVGNKTLNWFSNIAIHDSSNGFRLFSSELIKKYSIESNKGFAYSIELLVKATIGGYKIIEIPSIWIEREHGNSNFKLLRWIHKYLYWYFKAIINKWFKL